MNQPQALLNVLNYEHFTTGDVLEKKTSLRQELVECRFRITPQPAPHATARCLRFSVLDNSARFSEFIHPRRCVEFPGSPSSGKTDFYVTERQRNDDRDKDQRISYDTLQSTVLVKDLCTG